MSAKLGRTTDLTAELTQKIAAGIKRGLSRKQVARLVGIDVTTLYGWLRKGRAGEKDYVDFALAVEKAESDGISQMLEAVEKGARRDWRAAAFWLQRRDPDRWAEKPTPAVNVNIGDLDRLDEDALRKRALEVAARLKLTAADASEVNVEEAIVKYEPAPEDDDS